MGIAGASFVLSSCLAEQDKRAVVSPADKQPQFPWPYLGLKADSAAERAYSDYDKGHCMYATFTSIVAPIGETLGEPYTSFPFNMMKYGAGGACGWGSLCGALNGAAAVIGLFAPTEEQRNNLTSELFAWYEKTHLPTYAPRKAIIPMQIPTTISSSVLCHVSISNWCKASGYKAFSKEQRERCRRLTADTTKNTVELLNESLARKFAGEDYLSAEVKKCNSCHAKGGELENTKGKMYCGSCHFSLAADHPPSNNNRV
jgi:hypothetical protein